MLKPADATVTTKITVGPPASTAYQYRVLVLMLGGTMLAVLNNNMISVALPTIMVDFRVDLAQLTWVLAAQTLTLSATMPVWGRLGDVHGPKQMFLLGLAIFAVGSLLCVFSTSYFQLVLFRVVQSIGAASILPNSLALVNRTFPAHRRGRAMGFWSAGATVGQLLGPTVGGFLILGYNWHGLFWVNLPVAVAVFVAVGLGVRSLPPGPRKGRFDYLGAGSFTSGMLCLLLSLTLIRVAGLSSFWTPGLAAVGIALIAFFLYWESRHSAPIIDLSLFRNRAFTALITADAFRSFALFGSVWLLPIYFQAVQGHSPIESGLMLLPKSLAVLVAAPVAGLLADRFGGRRIALIGLGCLGASFGLFMGFDIQTSVFYTSLALTVNGFAQGFVQSPLVSSMMNVSPPDKLGAVSGLFTMLRFTSGSVGTTSTGLVLQSLIDRGLAGQQEQESATADGLRVVFGITAFAAFLGFLAIAFGWRGAARYHARTDPSQS